FDQHEHELLTAVAGEEILTADRLAGALGEFTQDEVAAQVAVLVVDSLELVDVEHQHGERPEVALGAGHFAVEELEQVALVMDLREAVDDREAIDLLVVLRLDVTAGKVAVNAVADAEIVAVLQEAGALGLAVVDKGAVGARLVLDDETVRRGMDVGV